jgi:hypothetical protein
MPDLKMKKLLVNEEKYREMLSIVPPFLHRATGTELFAIVLQRTSNSLHAVDLAGILALLEDAKNAQLPTTKDD